MSLNDAGERHERVFRAVLKHPGAQAEEIAVAARCSLADTCSSLWRLMGRGLIVRGGYSVGTNVNPDTVRFGRGQAFASKKNMRLGPKSPRRPKERVAAHPKPPADLSLASLLGGSKP